MLLHETANANHDFLAAVEAVIEAGGQVTPRYKGALNRWAELKAVPNESIVDHLAETIVSGQGTLDERLAFRAIAYAQTGADRRAIAQVDNRVERIIMDTLREEYAKVAGRNYEMLRRQWNKTAEAFTKAHAASAHLTDTADLATASAEARKGYTDALSSGAELDQFLPTVAVAAKLAGISLKQDGDWIGLFVEREDAPRRPLFDAWALGGVERWDGILALGATLRVPELEVYEAEPPLREIQYRGERTNSGGLVGYRQVAYDPERGEFPDESESLDPQAEQRRRIFHSVHDA